MKIIRWAAVFSVSPHVKKIGAPSKYYPLSGDRKTEPEKVMKKEDFDMEVQKYRDSKKGRA